MQLSPLAQRLDKLLRGAVNDPTHWPVTSRWSTGLAGVDQGLLAAAARELTAHLLEEPGREPCDVLVTAGAAGMDAEASARLAGELGPIWAAEQALVLGWDVEGRALFAEAVRTRADHEARRKPDGVTAWLSELPGYRDVARTALETAAARVAAIHAGELPYQAEKAVTGTEKAVLGRAARVALHMDEPWLPALLDGLLPGIAVAPAQARTLPSQGLLFELARATEEHPTPEAISALRAARAATRHTGVPMQLDRMFKRIEAALANRLEVAFRLPDGRVRQAVGAHTAVIEIGDGVELSWWHGDKKLKSVPAAVRREHPGEVKRLRELAKQTRQQQATLARALEAGYAAGAAAPPYRQLEGQPITDRLIWEFEVEPGVWRSEPGMTVPDVPVRLWHPARAPMEEVRAWREVVQDKELRQPFKQAFREVYLLTPAEEETATYSSRFAGHVVHYRRLYALFKQRGWQAGFLGPWDGGYEGTARRVMAGGRWRAVLDHGLCEQEYAGVESVCFERLTDGVWRVAPLTEVPALVFSEAMRDVDLFVAVTSIAADPTWIGHGPDRLREYWETGSFAELTPSAEVRRDALARLIGRTAIADRCTVAGRFLVVRGDLRTYKIHLGSGNVLMEPNDAYLCIVARADPHAGLFLPFEEDGRLALILSKAFLLAHDTAVTDPSITRQIRG
ncbi:DUF4132 domain-containing protein [Nonomuraea typhae]|uniref:DUF4132 domain-containing protein n=1 Tax=Nonomuraea typhae TaxID=2603600 RepID=A0ABW7YR28_9ACTN